jgi:hypothetical protein
VKHEKSSSCPPASDLVGSVSVPTGALVDKG